MKGETTASTNKMHLLAFHQPFVNNYPAIYSVIDLNIISKLLNPTGHLKTCDDRYRDSVNLGWLTDVVILIDWSKLL